MLSLNNFQGDAIMPAGRPRIKHEPDIYPTLAAATLLGVSLQRIQKLVQDEMLLAYVYDDDTGEFRTKQKDERRQGQTLYFYKSDIEAYATRERHAGRPEEPAKDKTSAYNKEYYHSHVKPKREQEKQEKARS